MKISRVVILSMFFSLSIFSQSGWHQVSKIDKGIVSSIEVMKFRDSETGYIAGSMNGIYKSTDGGNSWKEVYTLPYNITSILSISGNTINAFVKDNMLRTSYVMNSSDDGASWQKLAAFPKILINAGCFIPGGQGFFAGLTMQGSHIYASEDGIKWSERSKIVSIVTSMIFTGSQNGFAVCTGGLYNTTDGGMTWENVKVDNYYAYSLETVFFTDEMNGYITTNNNKFESPCGLLKTSDGGISWNVVIIDNNFWLRSVFFVNQNTGYAVGNNDKQKGVILKSTDSGNTWLKQSVPECSILFAVNFTDENTGYAGDSHGTVLKTTSGGE